MKTSFLSFILACIFVSGCGNYKLISHKSSSRWFPGSQQWKLENEQSQQKDFQDLVVKVAYSHKDLMTGNKIFIYISGTRNDALVAAIEYLPDEGTDIFATKKVDRYLIQSERIAASMGPSFEPFPDAEFERTVIAIAKNAEKVGGTATMVFLGWTYPVTFKAVIRGRCNADISVFKTEKSGPGPQIFHKTSNYCKPDYTPLSSEESILMPQ